MKNYFVPNSKITSQWTLTDSPGEIEMSYSYKGYSEDSYDDTAFWKDDFLKSEGSSLEEEISDWNIELQKAYEALDSDIETQQKYIDTIEGGLFGAETYNGWLYLEYPEEDYPDSENPVVDATINTLLYIICKIECFLDFNRKFK